MNCLYEEIKSFSASNVFNPWRDNDPLDVGPVPNLCAPLDGAGLRRVRLTAHFDCIPKFLLIGEAPGYQGCHFSGVAFTNEKLLMNDSIPRIELHGQRITTRERPWCEPSATIVWRTLHALNIAHCTVMWNAFAWHPHKPGEPMSNRAPTDLELSKGSSVLHAVVRHFDGTRLVAVGKVAEKALKRLGVRINGAVRHPSMGGANEFRSGLKVLAGS